MGRKAWLHPRRKELVKPHLVTTKSGEVKMVDSYLHDYPHKENEPNVKKTKKEGKEEAKKETKKNLEPNKKKMKEDLDKAEKDLACKMDA